MRKKPRQRREAPDQVDLETNIAPGALRDGLRQRDQRPAPPDSMPPRDDEREIDQSDSVTPTR